MKPPSKELPRPQLIHTIRVRLFIITGLLFLLNICGGLAHLLLEVRQNNVEMSTNMIENGTIITIIVATLLLLTFIWFIVQQIFNDIRKQLKVLSTTMASYNQGDDHIRMESMQHEEFYIFEKLFNDMIDRINQKNREIEQLELNFRLLTNVLPQIIWTANPDGYLDYYNQKWFDYTGMTLEQTQGWGWEPVLHPDDL
jgi:PAS domain-containing protein